MKKYFFFLIFIMICISTNAQKNINFDNEVDSINKILTQNKVAYYIGYKTEGVNGKMKFITFEKDGVVKVHNSICCNNKTTTCICQTQIPYFNLLAVDNWEIYDGYAYLKDKENLSIGRIYGLKKEAFTKLKIHFNSLRKLSLQYLNKREIKLIVVKKNYKKNRDDLPDSKITIKKINAEKEVLRKKLRE